MKNERIGALDVIRTLTAYGIVVYHFMCYTSCSWKPFFRFANGSWGNVCTTIFFMLSGMLLCLRYPSIGTRRQLGEFYYRRWKSIFPMFYGAYAVYFIKNVLASGRILFRGAAWKLLLSVAGLDGYFLYRVPDDYYLLGEWFLGAIVILYLLYPVLLWGFRRSEKAEAALVLFLYAGMVAAYAAGDALPVFPCRQGAGDALPVFQIEEIRNLFSCLLSFWIGMELAGHRQLLNDRRVTAGAWALIVLLALVRLPIDDNISVHLFALAIFAAVYDLGGRITAGSAKAAACFGWLGKLSFGVFLFQHVTIQELLAFKNPSSPAKMLVMLAVVCVYVTARAWCLKTVTDAVLSCGLYRRAERFLLRDRTKRAG